MPIKNLQLGQLLIESGLINEQQLGAALEQQKNDKTKRLGEILVEMGFLSEKDQMRALEARLKVPFIDLSEFPVDKKAPMLISEDLAKKYNVIPITINGRVLTVATCDPMNFYAIDDLRLATNMEIRVVLSTLSDIRVAINRYYSQQLVDEAANDVSREFDTVITKIDDILDERVDNAPVVRLVSSIIQQGIKLGASDIHIEPLDNSTRVRLRIDGVLQNHMNISAAAHSALITRLKILSNMNIAEHRIPQDGRIETIIDGIQVDLRLSVLPTVTGEKVVIRILGGIGSMLHRSDLGLSGNNERIFNDILKSPHGIILVSGPTGSGKTSTLYTILSEFNKEGSNIITVEDPVEYRVPGINQVQVNNKAGLTFASGLRSILRQDPDIIMVGEIRDSETAQIAVRAAITGHLVLSTIHTNDAASTVNRLINMEVEPFLVSSGVTGIIAQRLVRKICPKCTEEYKPSKYEIEMLGLPENVKLHRGAGCNSCSHTGYKGRTAIHEIIAMTKDLRVLIDKDATSDQIRDAAIKDGTITLQESCIKLVKDGITTFDEMLRVTYSVG